MLEDVESLWLVITEQTRQDYYVGHVSAPVARVAISTQSITILLDVNIGQFMAILAPLFSISSFSTTRLALRELSVWCILPVSDLFARYAEVRILLGEHPICILIFLPLIFLHRCNFLQEHAL